MNAYNKNAIKYLLDYFDLYKPINVVFFKVIYGFLDLIFLFAILGLILLKKAGYVL